MISNIVTACTVADAVLLSLLIVLVTPGWLINAFVWVYLYLAACALVYTCLYKMGLYEDLLSIGEKPKDS